MRYFIHLGYEGTNYSGWQRQTTTSNTIQQVIEDALSLIFKKKIIVWGCGRTDAGVHASQYVIHINLEEAPTFDLKFRLNKNLPSDIAVYEIFEATDEQHCRYHADARTYDYFLHWKKDPHLINFSSLYDHIELDFDLMRKATQLILNTKDFRPVCKQPDLYDNTICLVSECKLYVNEEQARLRFTITSNRFLRGMVRLCIFFLLKVGTKEISLPELERILNQEQELKQLQPALPNGLFLSKINYPFLQLKESNHLIKMLKLGLDF